jgi:hypothetical protein
LRQVAGSDEKHVDSFNGEEFADIADSLGTPEGIDDLVRNPRVKFMRGDILRANEASYAGRGALCSVQDHGRELRQTLS